MYSHLKRELTHQLLKMKEKATRTGNINFMSSNTETSEGKEHLIESGELTIGEPCSPYTLLKSCVMLDGNLEIKEK